MTDTDDEFVGREGFLEALWDTLERRSVLMVGPRRVGKSTLLAHLRGQPRLGAAVLVVDLQGSASVEELVDRLEDLLPSNPGRALVERIEEAQLAGVGVKLRGGESVAPWRRLEARLHALAADGALRVFALDEAPWWLDELERERPGAARTALAHLRRLRLDPKLAAVRWVLTGSVGIATRAGRWNASAELNDLDLIEVPPLDGDAGAALFEVVCTSAGRRVEATVAREGWRLGGGRPHWIRLLAERAAFGTPRGGVVDAEAIERETEKLLNAQHRHFFQEEGEGHFGREYSPEEERVARAVLDVLAVAEHPLPRHAVVTAAMREGSREVVESVLRRLVEDFYAVEGQGGIGVAVPLFGRWWQRWMT